MVGRQRKPQNQKSVHSSRFQGTHISPLPHAACLQLASLLCLPQVQRRSRDTDRRLSLGPSARLREYATPASTHCTSVTHHRALALSDFVILRIHVTTTAATVVTTFIMLVIITSRCCSYTLACMSDSESDGLQDFVVGDGQEESSSSSSGGSGSSSEVEDAMTLYRPHP
jgi:hypothetical protein